MSFEKFREAFKNYLIKEKIDFPDNLSEVSDLEFVVFINKYVRPHKENLDLALSSIETLIIAAGEDPPVLNDEQKKIIKRFLEAFVDLSNN